MPTLLGGAGKRTEVSPGLPPGAIQQQPAAGPPHQSPIAPRRMEGCVWGVQTDSGCDTSQLGVLVFISSEDQWDTLPAAGEKKHCFCATCLKGTHRAFTGHAPTGHTLTGHALTGHTPTGHAPIGHSPTGHTSMGHTKTPQGQESDVSSRRGK